MYAIVTDVMNERNYLAWWPANDGYFWTSREGFDSCMSQNIGEHRFAFRNHYEAVDWLMYKMDIPKRWKAKVIKLEET